MGESSAYTADLEDHGDVLKSLLQPPFEDLLCDSVDLLLRRLTAYGSVHHIGKRFCELLQIGHIKQLYRDTIDTYMDVLPALGRKGTGICLVAGAAPLCIFIAYKVGTDAAPYIQLLLNGLLLLHRSLPPLSSPVALAP